MSILSRGWESLDSVTAEVYINLELELNGEIRRIIKCGNEALYDSTLCFS